MDNDRFSRWLAAELERQGVSQGELARKMGMHQSTVSRVVRGTRNAGVDFYRDLIRALNVAPEIVLTEAGFMPRRPTNDPTLAQAGHILAQLSEHDQQMALAVLEAMFETAQRDRTRVAESDEAG